MSVDLFDRFRFSALVMVVMVLAASLSSFWAVLSFMHTHTRKELDKKKQLNKWNANDVRAVKKEKNEQTGKNLRS